MVEKHSQKGRSPVREPWVKSAMVYDLASLIALLLVSKKKVVRVADGICAGHYV